MADVGGAWDSSSRHKSQSVSEEQWANLMQAKTQSAPTPPHVQEPPTNTRSRFNSSSSGGRPSGSNRVGRGMTSSTSVCDLNTLSQQQLPSGQPQHSHQLVPRMGGMHPVRINNVLNLAIFGFSKLSIFILRVDKCFG